MIVCALYRLRRGWRPRHPVIRRTMFATYGFIKLPFCVIYRLCRGWALSPPVLWAGLETGGKAVGPNGETRLQSKCAPLQIYQNTTFLVMRFFVGQSPPLNDRVLAKAEHCHSESRKAEESHQHQSGMICTYSLAQYDKVAVPTA